MSSYPYRKMNEMNTRAASDTCQIEKYENDIDTTVGCKGD